MVNRKSLLLPAFVFCSVAALFAALGLSRHGQDSLEQEWEARQVCTQRAWAVEQALTQLLDAGETMAAIIRLGAAQDFLDRAAAEIRLNNPAVEIITLAPDGVIRHVSPPAGHEQALGLDLLENPSRQLMTETSLARRVPLVGGPYRIADGKQAFTGVVPVILNSRDGELFWGFCTALITLPRLAELTGLDMLEPAGLSVRLESRTTGGWNPVLTIGRTAHHVEAAVSELNVPGQRLRLVLLRTQAPPWLVQHWRGVVLALLAALGCAWAAPLLASTQRERVRRMEAGLARLRRGNEVLRRELRSRNAALNSCALAQQRNRDLFERSRAPMLLVDPDSLRIVSANTAASSLYGVARDRLEGMSLEALDTAPRATMEERLRSVVAQTHGPGPFLVRHWPPDGQPLDLEVYCGPLNLDGRTLVQSVLLDVTGREAERRELETARSAAEACSKGKSLFLASVSHELLSPLSAMTGLTELTLRGTLGPRQRENLEKALLAGHMLQDTIADMMDYAQLESGGLGLDSQPFFLGAVLDGVRERFELQAQRKQLDFTVRMGAGVPVRLVGDARRLTQVLANLVGNAVKFTPEGGVNLAVDMLEARDGVARLRFLVEDTGIGMDKKELELALEPFPQGEQAPPVPGTGLGLSIARRLLELMGATLSADSAKGRGSSFSFVLGLALPMEGALGGQAPSLEPGGMEDLKGVRVLVVDDSLLSLHSTEEMLTWAGVEVVTAQDGRSALEQLRARRVDAVLLDLHMPSMDGFQVFEAIRDLPGARPVPVLAVTGAAHETDRARCMQQGMAAFLTKPLDLDLLLASVRRALRDKALPPRQPLAVINREYALEMLLGNQELYRRLLAGFAREYAGAGARLSVLLRGGHLEEARALANTLKGLAANLGGERLSHAASRLDQALGVEGPVDPGLELDFAECLDEFLAQAASGGATA